VANLTLTIADDVLRRARIRALEQGTSVNAIVRSYLEGFADSGSRSGALEQLLCLATQSSAGSGASGRTWTREELHEQ
jgi:hypothetical protein